MMRKECTHTFISNCKGLFPQYLQMKRALGNKYERAESVLSQFDRFLCANFPDLSVNSIPSQAIEEWELRRPHEKSKTHSNRSLCVRKFCEYAFAHGHDVFVSHGKCAYKDIAEFLPYIYSRDEIRRFFRAADNRKYETRLGESELFYPTLFRVLYSCGLRASEALLLMINDVDIENRAFIVRDTKFGKTRAVPFNNELSENLLKYDKSLMRRSKDYFFESPFGGRYSKASVQKMFRNILYEADIDYLGRDKGPRIHDFRHTFAVRCLENWFNSGNNIQAKLPILSAYLGHADLRGTQRYLRLTSQMYPQITEQFAEKFGGVFPILTDGGNA